jgi:hypothetical protein
MNYLATIIKSLANNGDGFVIVSSIAPQNGEATAFDQSPITND